MKGEWFYAKNKQKVGPVTEEQLKELVRSGELSRNDMVWKEGMTNWQQAGAVDGLLSIPSLAPPEPPPLPDAATPASRVWWERLNRNKPAYLSALFAIALLLTCICSPVVSKVFGIFPDGLESFFRFMYALFGIGLFVGLVVAGFMALFRASTRAERLKSLWGKWEPVSGEGCSLWFYEDGGFLRNDGFGAKYTFDLDNDIITVNVQGFGQPIPLKIITITKHELIVNCGGQALHFKKGKTITDERWEESVERSKEFLKQAALVTGAATVGVIGLGVVVLGAAAIAVGGVAGASVGGGYGGGGSSSGGSQYRQVPCRICFQTGWIEGTTPGGSKKVCDRCGGKGYMLAM